MTLGSADLEDSTYHTYTATFIVALGLMQQQTGAHTYTYFLVNEHAFLNCTLTKRVKPFHM